MFLFQFPSIFPLNPFYPPTPHIYIIQIQWINTGGHEKSVEVHPLRTSTPTKPCNSVILVIFFSTVRAPCNCYSSHFLSRLCLSILQHTQPIRMHTIMAPKHIAIISKSEQISIVFIHIRLKIVLQMYGNLLTKSIRFLPLGVRLRVFWCVTYIEIVHLNTLTLRHQSLREEKKKIER